MRATRLSMGMPITIDLIDSPDGTLMETVFAYFGDVDRRFSTYRPKSEISAINRGEIDNTRYSPEMQEVLTLAERTRREALGYFDIRKPDGSLDPSGIVKGWAIRNATAIIKRSGARHFFIDAGGDIQSIGNNASGEDWRIGIRNPFNVTEIVKILRPRGRGVATSGTYVRGQHIYDPHAPGRPISDILSLTVVGPDVFEADRFATAAFAMGREGIDFIEQMPGLEGYVIDQHRRASMTSGFAALCVS